MKECDDWKLRVGCSCGGRCYIEVKTICIRLWRGCAWELFLDKTEFHLETTGERGAAGLQGIRKEAHLGSRTFLPDSRAINSFIFIIVNQLGNIELVRNLSIVNAQKALSMRGAKTTN